MRMLFYMLFYKSESIDISFFGLDFFKFWFRVFIVKYPVHKHGNRAAGRVGESV